MSKRLALGLKTSLSSITGEVAGEDMSKGKAGDEGPLSDFLIRSHVHLERQSL
jgi:hypothetical protein